MQSKNIHFECVTLRALDRLVEHVRDAARRGSSMGYTYVSPQELRDLNEFLLRPMRQIVAEMAANGLSQVEPTQRERENVTGDHGDRIPLNFRHCGRCGRLTRRDAQGCCMVCGSAKKAPAKTAEAPQQADAD